MKSKILLVTLIPSLLLISSCGDISNELNKLNELAAKEITSLKIETSLSKENDTLVGEFKFDKKEEGKYSLIYNFEQFAEFDPFAESNSLKTNVSGEASLSIDNDKKISCDDELPFDLGEKFGLSFKFEKGYLSDIEKKDKTLSAKVTNIKSFSGIDGAKSMSFSATYTNDKLEQINLDYVNGNDYNCKVVYNF